MANIKDFAVGIVVTAPSPATTGTTLTLRTGEAATMPAVPFYVTATPPGQLTTLGTAEKLLVTAVNTSTETLTFTRAQSPTTAKSIAAGWIIANAMYADDVLTSSQVNNEIPTGLVNGVNATFTTASPFSSIRVFKNGVRMNPGASNDYTVGSNNQSIIFNTAPASGSVIVVDSIIGSQVMINGSNSWVQKERVTGAIDGSNGTFTTARPYIAGTLMVYRNGLAEGLLVNESNPATGQFIIDAPATGDDLYVSYQYVQSVSGNADTVDGYHATTTLDPNTVPVLDTAGLIPYWGVKAKAYSGSLASTAISSTTAVAGTLTIPASDLPGTGNYLILVNLAAEINFVGTAFEAYYDIYDVTPATIYRNYMNSNANDYFNTGPGTALITAPAGVARSIQFRVGRTTGSGGDLTTRSRYTAVILGKV